MVSNGVREGKIVVCEAEEQVGGCSAFEQMPPTALCFLSTPCWSRSSDFWLLNLRMMFLVRSVARVARLLNVCDQASVHSSPRTDHFARAKLTFSLESHGIYVGRFAGTIRYSENFDPTCGVRQKPDGMLWLDYSHLTGMLNLVRVSLSKEEANVRLQWERVPRRDVEDVSLEWRLSVRATKEIKPFQELVRHTDQEEQYFWHQDIVNARKGFMKEVYQEKP